MEGFVVLLLLLAGLACFVAATFNLIARINAIALGLAFCTLAAVIIVWPG